LCRSAAGTGLIVPTTRFARLGARRSRRAEAILVWLPALSAAIGRTVTGARLRSIADIIPVTVDIGVSVDINVHVAAAPIAMIPVGDRSAPKAVRLERGSNRQADLEPLVREAFGLVETPTT